MRCVIKDVRQALFRSFETSGVHNFLTIPFAEKQLMIYEAQKNLKLTQAKIVSQGKTQIENISLQVSNSILNIKMRIKELEIITADSNYSEEISA